MKVDSSFLEDLFIHLKTTPSEKLESESIEFKHYESENSLHNCKHLPDEISAIANLNGGVIIVGVIDSSNVKDNNWESQLAGFVKIDLYTTKERIKGKIRPVHQLELSYFTFESKEYLCIEIPRHLDSLISTTAGKICIRDGKSSRPAAPEEIKELVKSLQFYDWSAENIDVDVNEVLNDSVVNAAMIDYRNRRNIGDTSFNKKTFLESIGATRNGILNKGGLLFLGKSESIKKHLGNYEYRFTWKEKNGNLKINEVWSDSLWVNIKKAKDFFNICNAK